MDSLVGLIITGIAVTAFLYIFLHNSTGTASVAGGLTKDYGTLAKAYRGG